MSLCLQITFSVDSRSNFLRNFVLKHATKLEVEGTAQLITGDKVKIIACGEKENVDSFIDVIHHNATKFKIENIELEPFIKGKDYRGVFRVIE